MSPQLLTFSEAGAALKTSRATVYRMVADGTLKAVQMRPRGSKKSRRRIPATEIQRLAKTGTK